MASYQILLRDFDLGQVIDALESRAQSWKTTAEYIRSGNISEEEDYVAEECSGEPEAERIAKHYQRILQEIRAQVLQQSHTANPYADWRELENSTATQR